MRQRTPLIVRREMIPHASQQRQLVAKLGSSGAVYGGMPSEAVHAHDMDLRDQVSRGQVLRNEVSTAQSAPVPPHGRIPEDSRLPTRRRVVRFPTILATRPCDVGRGRRRAPSCSYPPAGSSPALPSGHALGCRALGSRRGLDRPRGTGSASRLARGEGGLGHADQVPRCERVVLGAGLPQGGIADRRSTLRAPGEPCPPSLSQALHDGIPSSRSNANKCFCRDKVLTGRLFVRASRRTTSPGEPSA